MEYPEKIVEFDKYCSTCEHKDISEQEYPCNECLSNPTNTYSRKPVNYKKETKENKRLINKQHNKNKTK